MKKLLLAVLVVSAFSAASFAGEWGVGARIGVGQNDPKGMKVDYDNYGGTFTKKPEIFSVEGLYEWNVGGKDIDETGTEHKMGFRFGYDIYGKNKLEAAIVHEEDKKTDAIPLTLYYKNNNGINHVSFYIGGGMTYMRTEMRLSSWLYNLNNLDGNKWFPHIMVGAEYRFTKLFALGIDVKYNIHAKIEKNGAVIADRSGLQGLLAARFYF